MEEKVNIEIVSEEIKEKIIDKNLKEEIIEKNVEVISSESISRNNPSFKFEIKNKEDEKDINLEKIIEEEPIISKFDEKKFDGKKEEYRISDVEKSPLEKKDFYEDRMLEEQKRILKLKEKKEDKIMFEDPTKKIYDTDYNKNWDKQNI